MKKFSILSLILLLVSQMVVGPLIGTVNAVGITQPGISLEETGLEGADTARELVPGKQVKLTYKWTVDGQADGKKTATLPLPAQLTATAKNGGLSANGIDIGTYTVTARALTVQVDETDGVTGSDTITVTAQVADDATGSFSFGPHIYTIAQPIIQTVAYDEQSAVVESTPPAENGNPDAAGEEPSSAGEVGVTEESDETGTNLEAVDPPESGEPDDEGLADSSAEGVNETADETDASVMESGEPGEIEENIIVKDSIVLKDSKGNTVDKDTPLRLGEKLKLSLKWELDNDHPYIGGDTFTFQLPSQFAGLTIPSGNLNDYGTFKVAESGLVTFTFSDLIAGQSNIKGSFEIQVELDEQKLTSVEDVLEFKVKQDVIERIPVRFETTGGQAINKTGKHGDGRKFNTETIDWTVDVNTTRASLKNAIVQDTMQTNQELDVSSIKVFEADVNIKGEIVSVSPISLDLTGINKSTAKQLELELGNTDKAYRIQFTSKIMDKEGKEYPNTAILKSEGQAEKLSSTKISVGRQEHLKKTSKEFDKTDQSVEWTVEFNFDESPLEAGDTLTDTFSFMVGDKDESEKFKVEVIEILQVESFDDNGTVEKTVKVEDVFTTKIEGKTTTFTLNGNTNKPFIIKYKTKLIDTEYIHENGSLSNKVEINEVNKTSQQDVVQQVGTKTNSGINYKDRTIDWTIKVNSDNKVLKNFTLTDDFSGSGQELVGIPKVVKTKDGSEASVTPVRTDKGFTIDFGDISEGYTITYKTKYTYDFGGDETKPKFNNELTLNYITTTSDVPYQKIITNGVTPKEEVTSNGAKSGSVDNETKEITWTVDVNYNQLDLNDASLSDVIAENQSLIEDSIKVYETSVSEDGSIVVGNDVTETYEPAVNGKQITVNFKPMKKSYRVVFKTIDKDGIYNDNEKYENTVVFEPKPEEMHNLYDSVSFPDRGKFVGKRGKHNTEKWTVDWKLDINKSQSKLTDIEVTDDLGDKNLQVLLKDSFVLKQGNTTLTKGTDYTLEIDEIKNSFTLKIPNETDKHYVLTYSSYILAGETTNLINNVKFKSNNETVGTKEQEKTVQVKIGQASGSGEGVTGGLIVEKVDKDSGKPLPGVVFKLSTTIGGQKIVFPEKTTAADGTIKWSGLRFGKYILEEVIPDNYTGIASKEVEIKNRNTPEHITREKIENARKTGTVIIEKHDSVFDKKLPGATFKIKNMDTGQMYELTTGSDGTATLEVPFGKYSVSEVVAPPGYRLANNISGFTVEVRKPVTVKAVNDAIVEVSGKKTWDEVDSTQRPDDIRVKLYANGKYLKFTTASESTDWTYSFKDLNKYDADKKEIVYTVGEEELNGYDSNVHRYDITNTQKTIELSGEKIWKDDNDATDDRPESVVIQLMNGSTVVKEETVTAAKNWQYTFENLPEYDKQGDKIPYSIQEKDVPAGYEATVGADNSVTNLRVGKVNVTGTKSWKDGNWEKRPTSITVNLLRNGVKAESVTVQPNVSGEWTYAFTDLEEFDESGVKYRYSVEEDEIANYKPVLDGYDLTNVRVGKTSLSGVKTWKDGNAPERPTAITVNVLQNGSIHASQVVTAATGWMYEFKDLPKYDENGIEYGYTIDEEPVANYEKKLIGNNLVNVRSGKIDVTGTKTWKDNNASTRPSSITVQLLQNGELFGAQKVSAETGWNYAFNSLPKYDEEGIEYTYTIDEEPVSNYKKSVNGYNLTNIRTGTTSVTGTKTWKDEGASQRPDAILVNLLRNGTVVDVKTVTKESNWTYQFTGLPRYDSEGRAISYTIAEQDVPGYATQVNGYDLTNTRASQKTIEVTKSWLDDNAAERPASVTVDVFRSISGGTPVKVDTLTLTRQGDWKQTVRNLPAFDPDGKAYAYTVKEQAIEGYTSIVNGFDITNLRTGKTSVAGTKTWKDGNADSRPKAIYVKLLRNGELADVKRVSAEDNWKYAFTDLDAYDANGVAYRYIIEEEKVAGYSSKVDGYDLINTRIGTTAVDVTKVWKDDVPSDRPKAIIVELLRNGILVDTVSLTADMKWKFTFAGLDRYDANGNLYTYSVREQEVPGYTVDIQSKGDSFTITNTMKPGDVDSPGTPGDVDSPGTPGKPGDVNGPGAPGGNGTPNKPGLPGTSYYPNTPGYTGSGSQASSSNSAGKLPQTGEAYPYVSLSAGVLLILFGGWLLMTRRKKQLGK